MSLGRDPASQSDAPRRTQEEQGRFLLSDIKKHPQCLIQSDLSHLSLLFLQGSQFIAFRVRFVGRESSWVSREDELSLGRTSCFAGAVVIADRDAFRCFEA